MDRINNKINNRINNRYIKYLSEIKVVSFDGRKQNTYFFEYFKLIAYFYLWSEKNNICVWKR